jgi:hypothetical protein
MRNPFFRKMSKFYFRGNLFKYAHQIHHEILPIISWETKLSTFVGQKRRWSNLFLVFQPKHSIGTRATCLYFSPIELKFLPQIAWTILQRYFWPCSFSISSSGFIGFFVLKMRIFGKKCRIFLYKRKTKQDFQKCLKVPLRYTGRYLRKKFQPNRTHFCHLVQCPDEDVSKTSILDKKPCRQSLQTFLLEHVSRHFRCSISGYNFNRIGLAVFEIWKPWKKRGVPLIFETKFGWILQQVRTQIQNSKAFLESERLLRWASVTNQPSDDYRKKSQFIFGFNIEF